MDRDEGDIMDVDARKVPVSFSWPLSALTSPFAPGNTWCILGSNERGEA